MGLYGAKFSELRILYNFPVSYNFWRVEKKYGVCIYSREFNLEEFNFERIPIQMHVNLLLSKLGSVETRKHLNVNKWEIQNHKLKSIQILKS